MQNDYKDWPSRKLKRRYWKSIKAVWRGPWLTDRTAYPTTWKSEMAALIDHRDKLKAEIERRGWDV